MENCPFCKIIEKEISSKIIYEDKDILAFEDINPQAPCHFLMIPKIHITTLNDLTEKNMPLIGKLVLGCTNLAKEKGLEENGYRLVWNCNKGGGQTVFHIHIHVLGGRQLTWPPG